MNGQDGPPTAQSKTGGKQELLLLGAVMLVALLVRLWLVQLRWVNPDEGAHLMDGKLILEGLVPGVDFGSRQVIYSYLTSLAVRVLGTDLFRLRLFPVAVTLTSGLFIHLIGRRTMGWRAGIVASALFLLLPFGAVMSVHTKTEPLAILAAVVAMYFLVRAHGAPERRLRWVFLSGMSAGVAFYVRESTLAILAALLVVLALEQARRWRRAVTSAAVLVGGMATVAVLVNAFYLRFMPLAEALTTPTLNPIAFVAQVLGFRERLVDLLSAASHTGIRVADAQGLTGLLSAVPRAVQESFARADRLDLATSIGYFTEAATTSAVLGVGAVLGAVVMVGRWLDDRSGNWLWAQGLPLAWGGFVGLAYAVWTVKRGFYPAYFQELTPPLALLTAGSLVWCWRHLPARWTPLTHAGALASLTAGLAFIHLAAGTRQISLALYFVISALVLGVFHLPRPDDAKPLHVRAGVAVLVITILGAAAAIAMPTITWIVSLPLALAGIAAVLGLMRTAGFDVRSESRSSLLAFVGYVILAGSFWVGLSESALRLSMRYQSIWTPESVREVAEVLRDNTDPDDTVISGAVIWELQADRTSFANVSHPLGFLTGMSDDFSEYAREELRSSPPAAVVLDSRTERTWLALLPELRDIIEDRYRLVSTVTGSAFPVTVYVAEPEASEVTGAR